MMNTVTLTLFGMYLYLISLLGSNSFDLKQENNVHRDRSNPQLYTGYTSPRQTSLPEERLSTPETRIELDHQLSKDDDT
jgi:hypothetical protein